jgi:hypothetical protein
MTVRTTAFSTADDEYTPAQRRVLDASLAEADKGPYFGPFKNGAEVAACMKKRQQTAKPTKLKNLDERSLFVALHRAASTTASAN